MKIPYFLFIHGAGGTHNKWRRLIKLLPDHLVKTVNLPGRNGISKDGNPSIEDYADFLNQHIDDDVIVVGHSMGGLVGIELASKSKYVKGLVLAASHYHIPVDSKVLSSFRDGTFPKGLFYASYSREVDKSLLAEEEIDNDNVSVDTVYAGFSACDQYESRGKQIISKLTIPILAILGDEDRLLPKTSGRELSQVNSRIKINYLEGSGHFGMLEEPEKFYDRLKEFSEEHWEIGL